MLSLSYTNTTCTDSSQGLSPHQEHPNRREPVVVLAVVPCVVGVEDSYLADEAPLAVVVLVDEAVASVDEVVLLVVEVVAFLVAVVEHQEGVVVSVAVAEAVTRESFSVGLSAF